MLLVGHLKQRRQRGALGAAPHQCVGLLPAHVHLDGVVALHGTVQRYQTQLHRVGKVDGVGGVLQVVVHGVGAAGALHGQLGQRHRRHGGDHRYQLVDIGAVGQRVGVIYQAALLVDGEEHGVEIGYHRIVFGKVERLHRRVERDGGGAVGGRLIVVASRKNNRGKNHCKTYSKLSNHECL